MKPTRILCLAALWSGVLTLNGCGFHLRGPIELPAGIHSIYLQTDQPNRPFVITLRDLILSNHLNISEAPGSADLIVVIQKITHTSQQIALSGSAEAGQYQLLGQIQFSVMDHNGKILIPTQTVSSSSTYTSNATQILSSQSQTEALWRAMQTNLANQILDQLAKLNAFTDKSQNAPSDAAPSKTASPDSTS
jgi:LPS-assembly lipoprotein